VQVLGISFDSPAANALFSRRWQIPFPLLSDRERSAGRAYGACKSPSSPAAKRITYLIGADGRVEQAWSGLPPAEHARVVLEYLSRHGPLA
jgi:peroxiredoxin Q/BCP